jgi:hypothetical protein
VLPDHARRHTGQLRRWGCEPARRANKPIYCGCLSEGLKALDDDTIVIAAARVHKNSQDRVRAKSKGRPEPVPPPSALDRLEQRCKELAG